MHFEIFNCWYEKCIFLWFLEQKCVSMQTKRTKNFFTANVQYLCLLFANNASTTTTSVFRILNLYWQEISFTWMKILFCRLLEGNIFCVKRQTHYVWFKFSADNPDWITNVCQAKVSSAVFPNLYAFSRNTTYSSNFYLFPVSLT